MQSPFFLVWRGQGEAGDLAAVIRRVEQENVVAFGRGRPVAVDRLGLEDALALGLVDQATRIGFSSLRPRRGIPAACGRPS